MEPRACVNEPTAGATEGQDPGLCRQARGLSRHVPCLLLRRAVAARLLSPRFTLEGALTALVTCRGATGSEWWTRPGPISLCFSDFMFLRFHTVPCYWTHRVPRECGDSHSDGGLAMTFVSFVDENIQILRKLTFQGEVSRQSVRSLDTGTVTFTALRGQPSLRVGGSTRPRPVACLPPALCQVRGKPGGGSGCVTWLPPRPPPSRRAPRLCAVSL